MAIAGVWYKALSANGAGQDQVTVPVQYSDFVTFSDKKPKTINATIALTGTGNDGNSGSSVSIVSYRTNDGATEVPVNATCLFANNVSEVTFSITAGGGGWATGLGIVYVYE